MKTLIIIFMLMLSFFMQAQNHTRKYNDYLKRYEYYDSSGNMIGYNKWNSYLKQWEYTYTRSSNRNQRAGNQTLREYPKYSSPYNLGVIGMALQEKQRLHDENLYRLNNKIEEFIDVYEYITDFNGGLTDNQTKEYSFMADQINSIRGDFSNTNWVNNNISVINSYIRTMKRWKPQENGYLNNGETLLNQPYRKSVTKHSPIIKQPYYKSEQITSADEGYVNVLGKVNNSNYYKVEYKGIVGYMLATWLK